MHARNTSLFLVTTVLVAVFACGQTERKVISKVAPVYSPLLKQKMIGGVVRIVAVVSPSGTVQRIEVVGGNPILVTAAQEAVTKWKFTPAETETREPVTFTFDPANHHYRSWRTMAAGQSDDLFTEPCGHNPYLRRSAYLSRSRY